jgi:hypothetical protein
MLRRVRLKESLSVQLVETVDLMSANYWGIKEVLSQQLFVQRFMYKPAIITLSNSSHKVIKILPLKLLKLSSYPQY